MYIIVYVLQSRFFIKEYFLYFAGGVGGVDNKGGSNNELIDTL